MEYERVVGPNGRNELWAYEWNLTSRPPVKVNRVRLGIEQPAALAAPNYHGGEAICWSYGRTLGNIATANHDVLAAFPGAHGSHAILECEIVEAGKFQNGKDRWWCRTHQMHWGKLADLADATQSGVMRCAQQSVQPMWYVVDPPHIRLDQHAEVAIWCSLPAALTSHGVPPKRYPRIHVHVRNEVGGFKALDKDFEALAALFDPHLRLFGDAPIDRVHITPPAAKEFVLAIEFKKPVTCFNCYDCGSPHLDLGEFVNVPHKKHLCGNCGRTNTWTQVESTSTPLKPLHDCFDQGHGYLDVDRVLNIDEYPDAQFALWASTPAVVWTAARPQERGIHVHLSIDGKRIIDNTFGTVIYKGKSLDRRELLQTMIHNTLDA